VSRGLLSTQRAQKARRTQRKTIFFSVPSVLMLPLGTLNRRLL
jgi:hypothetical protein